MNGFHVKAKSDRFTAVSSCCCQNLKYENFTSSFGTLRQNIAPKIMPHLQQGYFSPFNQSNHWFVALSLTLLSSNLKLPIIIAKRNDILENCSQKKIFCFLIKWINWSETAQKVLTIWLSILWTNSLFLRKDHIDLIHVRNFTWIQILFVCFRSRFQHKGSSSWIAISTEECFRCCGHWNTASENYREQGCSPSCSLPCTGHSVTICCCTTTENCQEQVEKATICHWWCRLPHQRNVLVTNS